MEVTTESPPAPPSRPPFPLPVADMSMVSVLHVSLSDAPEGVDGRVNAVSYSRCGGYFYTTTNDGVLGLYDAGTGSRLSEFHVKDTGCRLVTATHHPMGVLHASGLPPLKRDAPPDSGLDVGQVVYHNLHENKVMRVFRGHKDRVTSICMNPANDLFLTTSLDGTFRVWDLRTSSPVAVGPLASSSAEAAAAVTGAAIPPKPTQALSDVLEARGSFDNTGKIFAVAVSIAAERNGAPISLTMYNAERIGEPQEAGRCFFPARANYESKERERDNAFHPVHRLSFPNREDGDTSIPKCTCLSFTALEFSPDGKLIALGTLDRGVIVVDSFNPRKEYALLAQHPFSALHPCGVAWSPDSSCLAVGGTDGHVWVYNCKEGVAGGLPDLSHVKDTAAHEWSPSLPPPTFVLAGEGGKGEAALAAALAGAKDYRARMQASDLKLWEMQGQQARKTMEEMKNMRPSSILWKSANITVPMAANAGEMVGRMEGPIAALAWHPTACSFLSASRGTVAVWGRVVGGNGGGGGEGTADSAQADNAALQVPT